MRAHAYLHIPGIHTDHITIMFVKEFDKKNVTLCFWCVLQMVYKQRGTYGNDTHEDVRSLKLRFFTPREIANLMCFPAEFSKWNSCKTSRIMIQKFSMCTLRQKGQYLGYNT